jgi:hypothetical protein
VPDGCDRSQSGNNQRQSVNTVIKAMKVPQSGQASPAAVSLLTVRCVAVMRPSTPCTLGVVAQHEL